MTAQSDGPGFLGQFAKGNYPSVSGHAMQLLWDLNELRYYVNDSLTWKPLDNSRTLVLSGQPIILPSNGTMGANGALSGITALNAVYSNGCWMSFPAGKVYSGSPAASFWTVMTSTTQGTVYQNTINTGQPQVVTTPVPVVDAGPGAFVQTSGSMVTVLSIPVPAFSIGPNGGIRVYTVGSNDLAAGTKSGQFIFGPSGGFATFSNSTVNASGPSIRVVANRGITGQQVGIGNTGMVPAVPPPPITNDDTTIQLFISMQLQITNAATNTCQYDIIHVEAFYGP